MGRTKPSKNHPKKGNQKQQQQQQQNNHHHHHEPLRRYHLLGLFTLDCIYEEAVSFAVEVESACITVYALVGPLETQSKIVVYKTYNMFQALMAMRTCGRIVNDELTYEEEVSYWDTLFMDKECFLGTPDPRPNGLLQKFGTALISFSDIHSFSTVTLPTGAYEIRINVVGGGSIVAYHTRAPEDAEAILEKFHESFNHLRAAGEDEESTKKTSAEVLYEAEQQLGEKNPLEEPSVDEETGKTHLNPRELADQTDIRAYLKTTHGIDDSKKDETETGAVDDEEDVDEDVEDKVLNKQERVKLDVSVAFRDDEDDDLTESLSNLKLKPDA